MAAPKVMTGYTESTDGTVTLSPNPLGAASRPHDPPLDKPTALDLPPMPARGALPGNGSA
jgi:hypothetical protein